MPNKPAPGTVSTSFTLPRTLLDLVETRARRELTNKSQVIRDALMAYLAPEEAEYVRRVAEGRAEYGSR